MVYGCILVCLSKAMLANTKTRATQKRITARQKQVFDYVREYITTNHFAPSIREVADHFGFASPAAAANHLRALEKKGLLKRHGAARSIEILQPQPPVLRGIPVLGKVPAGAPVLAVEDFDDFLSIERLFGESEDLFALRVRGQSMTGAGIFDGDLVVVRSQPQVRNGEIGVVVIGDESEATVKRIFIEKHGVRLQPENASFSPIFLRQGESVFRVIGRVVGVVRRM